MAFDRGFHIHGEVRVDSGCRVLSEQRYTFVNRPAHRLRRVNDSNGEGVVLNNNFRAGAHSFHQRRKIIGRFLLRDMNYAPSHTSIIHRYTFSQFAIRRKCFRIRVGVCCGRVAQLGEHLVCNQGVAGSIPVTSTNFLLGSPIVQEFSFR
jgi:hypothetical protein